MIDILNKNFASNMSPDEYMSIDETLSLKWLTYWTKTWHQICPQMNTCQLTKHFPWNDWYIEQKLCIKYVPRWIHVNWCNTLPEMIDILNKNFASNMSPDEYMSIDATLYRKWLTYWTKTLHQICPQMNTCQLTKHFPWNDWYIEQKLCIKYVPRWIHVNWCNTLPEMIDILNKNFASNMSPDEYMSIDETLSLKWLTYWTKTLHQICPQMNTCQLTKHFPWNDWYIEQKLCIKYVPRWIHVNWCNTLPEMIDILNKNFASNMSPDEYMSIDATLYRKWLTYWTKTLHQICPQMNTCQLMQHFTGNDWHIEQKLCIKYVPRWIHVNWCNTLPEMIDILNKNFASNMSPDEYMSTDETLSLKWLIYWTKTLHQICPQMNTCQLMQHFTGNDWHIEQKLCIKYVPRWIHVNWCNTLPEMIDILNKNFASNMSPDEYMSTDETLSLKWLIYWTKTLHQICPQMNTCQLMQHFTAHKERSFQNIQHAKYNFCSLGSVEWAFVFFSIPYAGKPSIVTEKHMTSTQQLVLVHG